MYFTLLRCESFAPGWLRVTNIIARCGASPDHASLGVRPASGFVRVSL